MVVKRCKLNTPSLTFGKHVSPSKICPKLTLLSSITAFPVQGAHMLSRNQIVAGLVMFIILCNHCRNSSIQSNAGILIVICTLYFDLVFFLISYFCNLSCQYSTNSQKYMSTKIDLYHNLSNSAKIKRNINSMPFLV